MTQTIPSLTRTAMHPYEESATVTISDSEQFAEQMHERISTDLKTFGSVLKITGDIALTHRHGVHFDGVEAHVRNPRIRVPLRIAVIWHPEDGSLSYANALGDALELTPKSYGGQLGVRDEELELIDTVMSRMNDHPAWAPWTDRQTRSTISNKGDISILAAGSVLGASGPIVADLAFWDPVSLALTACSAVFTGLLTGCLSVAAVNAGYDATVGHKAERSCEQINSAAKKWSAERKESFSSLFSSPSEKALFFDAFLALCESAGIEYTGGLQVCRAPQRNEEHPLDLDEMRQEGEVTRERHAVLLNKVLVFDSEKEPGVAKVFDGRRFFLCDNEKGEVYPIG